MNAEGQRATPCRLIVDPAASGAWQMAVDEALLDTAAERGQASLRFYGWSEPTLSLGYFQSFRDCQRHRPSCDCPRVRRQTGGGAILHDDELTYSLALPVAHPLAADATRLYKAVHEALCSMLNQLGIAAALRPLDDPTAGGAQPFLCFQRATQGDVLVGSLKVCGSAQRRRRGAVLQHGSLLLGTSSRAPELPGIGALVGRQLQRPRLIESWSVLVARRLGLELAAGQLSALELDAVRRLAIEKYSTARWNERR
jgi:lipoate-protein ligase A